LAHIFLSGNNRELQIGNFIGDFVKGSRFNEYPDGIRRGIKLHRKIDEFTDSHPVVLETLYLLKPEFGRYSGIILDMYFDYFLATKFSVYSSKQLNVLAFRFYLITLFHYRNLPVKVKSFIFHFIFTNRLKKYSSLGGLKNSLEIMANYKTSAIDPDKSIQFLVKNHAALELNFHQFFQDLIEFVKTENNV
jgi:acyl carrier protein phosphodiesterase